MADITVYGAGIFGLSVAWACQARGATVQVVDPNGPAAGASGGLVGALAPHTPDAWNAKKQFQFESLDMAADYWAEVADASGADPGYGRIGRWQPVRDARGLALARCRADTAADHWQGRYGWRVLPHSACHGVLDAPGDWIVQDTLSARIHPRRATRALAAAIVARGGRIDAAPKGPVGVEVWATGAAGLEALSRQIGTTVGNAVKGQAALLAADLGPVPQIYADGIHIVPHADGTTAIGSTSERSFDDPATTDGLLDAVLDRARALCPPLAGAAVLERWAGLRPRARSRAPMLGPHPTRPGAFIANGGFKIGFGMAPKVGQVMADLILSGTDAIPEAFRPEASLP